MIYWQTAGWDVPVGLGQETSQPRRPGEMYRVLEAWKAPVARRRYLAALACALALAGCSGGVSIGDLMPGSSPSAPAPQPGGSIGQGQVKAGLILPLSATGNAAVAAQSMRN